MTFIPLTDCRGKYRMAAEVYCLICNAALKPDDIVEVTAQISPNRLVVRTGNNYHKVKGSTFNRSAIRL